MRFKQLAVYDVNTLLLIVSLLHGFNGENPLVMGRSSRVLSATLGLGVGKS